MNREPEVSQITKDNLQAAIRSKLFILPAFRLKGKQIDVFKTYALSSLSKEIDKIKFNRKNLQSISPHTLDQPSQSTQISLELYNFQGFLKKIKLLHLMISKKTWIKLLVSISFFLGRICKVWI